MIIDDLKDLEILKNALENYISNGEKMMETMIEEKLSQSLIKDYEKKLIKANSLLTNINAEFSTILNKTVDEKIKNENVIKIDVTNKK